MRMSGQAAGESTVSKDMTEASAMQKGAIDLGRRILLGPASPNSASQLDSHYKWTCFVLRLRTKALPPSFTSSSLPLYLRIYETILCAQTQGKDQGSVIALYVPPLSLGVAITLWAHRRDRRRAQGIHLQAHRQHKKDAHSWHRKM